jgi:rod shape determining protein RodA
MADYQRERIIVGFNPMLDPDGKGMQPLLSKQCIGNGGLFGIGLMGKGDYEYLPASHTDFIFATVCEKFGFFGGALVVISLAVLALRLFWLGYKCRETIGKLICCGCAGMIIIQSLENLWMCLALVPVVGITLPFVSAGGSSLLATYILVGLAHSVSAQEKKYYFSKSLT